MNVITLIPTRNEDWILDSTLKTVSSFSDFIIIADQHSKDRTREICGTFPKVRIVDNNAEGHSNTVRWLLLDEARKIPGHNLIFCIDADEMISVETAETIRKEALKHGEGTAYSLPWIQLWKGFENHRIDSVWRDNNKIMAFRDGAVQYKKEFVINDHTSRVPDLPGMPVIHMPNCPLLHFQFAAWHRTQVKQAWYRCSEFIKAPKDARRINHKYSITLDSRSVKTEPVPEGWLRGISIPPQETLERSDSAQLKEIKAWFGKYGIEFFEPLQIWHIQELHDMFKETTGRQPRPKTYPWILVKLNTLRHGIKRL